MAESQPIFRDAAGVLGFTAGISKAERGMGDDRAERDDLTNSDRAVTDAPNEILAQRELVASGESR